MGRWTETHGYRWLMYFYGSWWLLLATGSWWWFADGNFTSSASGNALQACHFGTPVLSKPNIVENASNGGQPG